MKILSYIILFVVALSCAKNIEQEMPAYDFGKVEFEEPFRGLLKEEPKILKQSLRVPPFRWLQPDTLVLSKTFIVEFNEDAVRSNSVAYLQFVDNENNRIDYVDFYLNDKLVEGNVLKIPADSLYKELNLMCRVNPKMGKHVTKGKVIVASHELDQINSSTINQEKIHLADWTVEQDYNIPWLLWLLWLLSFILVIAIFIGICYLLFYVVKMALPVIMSLFEGAGSTSSISKGVNNDIKKNISDFCIQDKNQEPQDDDDEEADEEEDDDDLILRLESELYSEHTVTEKYEILEKIRLILDELYKSCKNKYDRYENLLKPNTWDALEEAWKLWDPTPKNNVESEAIDGRCILSSTHGYYQACKELNFTSCDYDIHGSPDFTDVTYPGTIADVSDLYDSISIPKLKQRGGSKSSFQEIAQVRIARNMEQVLRQWAEKKGVPYDQYDCYYAWRNEHDLVPHEDTNCRTIRLVYRPAHEAFDHRGGIANAKNIKKHFNHDNIV